MGAPSMVARTAESFGDSLDQRLPKGRMVRIVGPPRITADA
jgi:hypothetical protein